MRFYREAGMHLLQHPIRDCNEEHAYNSAEDYIR